MFLVPARPISPRRLLVAAVVAGSFGAVLTVLGVSNPFTDALTLLFLAVVPAAAVASLVPGSGPVATVAVALAGSVAVNALVAESMLALGVWSPRGGVLAVGSISALCVAARRLRHDRIHPPTATRPPRRPSTTRTTVQITVVHPGDLGETELARWRSMQRALPHLANPFLSPDFTVAVGRLRDDVRVAVLSDGPETVGFFPFERRGLGLGLPVAAGLTDCQGLVHAPGLEWDPQELLRACGLVMWEFDHLVDGQRPFEPYLLTRASSPVMDLSDGFESYFALLRANSRKFAKDLLYKERKLGRDAGELRFVLDVRDRDALRTLMAWKSDQYRRTGRNDRFAQRWIVDLVDSLLDTRVDGFAGLLSMLYADGQPVAGHFGLRFDDVLAGWFPAYDTRFARYSPGLIQHLRMAEAGAAVGIRSIDMGKGVRDYKDSLKNDDLVVAEGRVVRLSAATSLQASLHWARRAPTRWLRNTVLDHPPLLRIADRTLKEYGRVRSARPPIRVPRR